jgi:hypothetical protein
MECPICKNNRGFACGTCIECGYNYLDNTYHFIEVRTELLERLVSPEIFKYLVSEHNKHKQC